MTDIDTTNEDYLLDEVWTLYFHDPHDPCWKTESYVRLADISSARDYASVAHVIEEKIIHGMFFVMREQVYPCWDDKYNIDGGCVSMKVSKRDAKRFWDETCKRMLSESLYLPRGMSGEDHCSSGASSASVANINGLSISSKPLHSIVKLWMSKEAAQNPTEVVQSLNLPEGVIGEVMFRSNRELIGSSQTRAQYSTTT